MASEGYWKNIMRGRLTRRKALAAASATSFAVSLLAACSGDDASRGSGTSGLVAEPVDTSKQAQRGGVMLSYRDREVDTSDPYFRSRTQPGTALTYSRLFRQKPGYLAPPAAEFMGDLADSWEFSGDRRQLTIKLRTLA
jgi:hypothetical protein